MLRTLLLLMGAGTAWAAGEGVGPVHLVPAWHADGEGAGSLFGTRAMGAGDVYGDGCDDLIVGAPHADGARGKAYLYRGSRRGLGAKAVWTAEGEAPGENFGDRVGQAGDLNGDGHGDVFVSAPDWRNGLGRCAVFYGSARGLKAAPDRNLGGRGGEMYADCTHPTGDLFGDGYDDLAVGAYAWHDQRGRIELFRGSSRGLGPKPVWSAEGEADHGWYGYGIGVAGDVYGDGYDDLLAGAKYLDQPAGRAAGKVYLYRGSAHGPSPSPDWTWGGDRADANAGVRVAAAGDVNGDGYADVLITAPGADGRRGDCFVFLGSPKGLADKPDWTVSGAALGLEFFGEGACPVGDIDGDGYDDVAIGGRDAHGLGHVLIYRGGPRGLDAEPSWEIDGESGGDRFGWWLAPAGDLDGDGLADLVISADSHGAGRVYVVYGRQCREALKHPSAQIHPTRLRGYLKSRSRARAQP